MNFKENKIILGCLNANYRDEVQADTQNNQIKERREDDTEPNLSHSIFLDVRPHSSL
jgi:hypothetical protein